jgi:hypothetical protein
MAAAKVSVIVAAGVFMEYRYGDDLKAGVAVEVRGLSGVGVVVGEKAVAIAGDGDWTAALVAASEGAGRAVSLAQADAKTSTMIGKICFMRFILAISITAIG